MGLKFISVWWWDLVGFPFLALGVSVKPSDVCVTVQTPLLFGLIS